jgi:hypothetical protein
MSDRPGILARTGRGVKKVARAYVWTITGDLKERKEDFRRIKDGLDRILNRRYRHESFEDAIARAKVTDSDLAKRADFLSAMAFLYGLVSAISLLFLLATKFSPNPINHALMSTGVALVSGSRYLAVRFRVAQIRARELFSFKEWILGQKGRW